MSGALLVTGAAILAYCIYYLLKRRSIARNGRVVPPIEEILQRPEDIQVNLHSVHTPAISGYPLKILSHLFFTKLGRYFLLHWVLSSSNLNLFANLVIPEPPTLTYSPPPPSPIIKAVDNKSILLSLMRSDKKARFSNTVRDFYDAYKSGKTTPLDVAHAVLAAIEDSNRGIKPLRAIIACNSELVLAMAERSTKRWETHSQLSLLDGIPISIKEDFCMDLYPCYCGTTFIPEFIRNSKESTVVKSILDRGAIVIGIANMPELGTNSIGNSENSFHKQPRNPFNPDYFPGGSSSGCAVSVASNLCPISLGGDGGGSGRVPAAVCGIYTLKLTQARLHHTGSYGSRFSFSTLTPITNSPLDIALALDVICNDVPESNEEVQLPSVPLELDCLGTLGTGLSGLTVGVYWDWVEAADKETVGVFREAVRKLTVLGMLVKYIKIPELEELRVAHVITSVGELAALMSMDVDKNFDKLGPSALTVAVLGHSFSAVESVNAMKQRTRTVTALKAVFKQVDVIATPTVGCPAPRITPEYLSSYGKLDGEAIGLLEIFTFLANFTGVPAITVPIGILNQESNLPVGMQLIAPWYQEAKLIKYAHLLDSSGEFPALKPKILYKVLNE